ncbi:hypothetical protein L6164_033931 [Bauhinia variegata]|uniref:Uncharacterized protein n=1 Tax=Bauhinia variegata TaxID=167791 RepID=A0ACB9KT84_BAUVA|nr:hypothetical protein L6164_033931 [Bauhinia variegata]
MADKHPHLNGAYYGPAIPAAEQPHRQYSSSRGRSCCCCLFGFLWKLLLAIIVIVGLAILIFWLIVQPRSFKYYVSDAQLTQFEYNNNNSTLRYNLVLNFTARNPNKKLSIYYDKVEGRAFYEGHRLNDTDVITHMNSFRQYKKSTNTTSGVFSGQQPLLLDSEDLSQFNEDKKRGFFEIDVKLYFRIRFRLGDSISGDYHPKATCELKLPLNSTATFRPTKCDVDF